MNTLYLNYLPCIERIQRPPCIHYGLYPNQFLVNNNKTKKVARKIIDSKSYKIRLNSRVKSHIKSKRTAKNVKKQKSTN